MAASLLDAARVSAHDRLKHSFRRWFWTGVLTATAAHFVVFILNPSLTIAVPDDRPDRRIGEVVRLPDIDEPPPPEELVQPEPPVLPKEILGVIVPVPDRLWEPEPIRDLRPPEPPPGVGEPFVGPSEVAPRIRDLDRAREIVKAHYPAMLRDARIEGTAIYWAYVDIDGRLVDVRLHTSSGHPRARRGRRASAARDRLRVSDSGRPPTATARSPVWIRQAITFSVR